jgi:uncharacterized repeat protein (TIGR02543 family)
MYLDSSAKMTMAFTGSGSNMSTCSSFSLVGNATMKSGWSLGSEFGGSDLYYPKYMIVTSGSSLNLNGKTISLSSDCYLAGWTSNNAVAKIFGGSASVASGATLTYGDSCLGGSTVGFVNSATATAKFNTSGELEIEVTTGTLTMKGDVTLEKYGNSIHNMTTKITLNGGNLLLAGKTLTLNSGSTLSGTSVSTITSSGTIVANSGSTINLAKAPTANVAFKFVSGSTAATYEASIAGILPGSVALTDEKFSLSTYCNATFDYDTTNKASLIIDGTGTSSTQPATFTLKSEVTVYNLKINNAGANVSIGGSKLTVSGSLYDNFTKILNINSEIDVTGSFNLINSSTVTVTSTVEVTGDTVLNTLSTIKSTGSGAYSTASVTGSTIWASLTASGTGSSVKVGTLTLGAGGSLQNSDSGSNVSYVVFVSPSGDGHNTGKGLYVDGKATVAENLTVDSTGIATFVSVGSGATLDVKDGITLTIGTSGTLYSQGTIGGSGAISVASTAAVYTKAITTANMTFASNASWYSMLKSDSGVLVAGPKVSSPLVQTTVSQTGSDSAFYVSASSGSVTLSIKSGNMYVMKNCTADGSRIGQYVQTLQAKTADNLKGDFVIPSIGTTVIVSDGETLSIESNEILVGNPNCLYVTSGGTLSVLQSRESATDHEYVRALTGGTLVYNGSNLAGPDSSKYAFVITGTDSYIWFDFKENDIGVGGDTPTVSVYGDATCNSFKEGSSAVPLYVETGKTLKVEKEFKITGEIIVAGTLHLVSEDELGAITVGTDDGYFGEIITPALKKANISVYDGSWSLNDDKIVVSKEGDGMLTLIDGTNTIIPYTVSAINSTVTLTVEKGSIAASFTEVNLSGIIDSVVLNGGDFFATSNNTSITVPVGKALSIKASGAIEGNYIVSGTLHLIAPSLNGKNLTVKAYYNSTLDITDSSTAAVYSLMGGADPIFSLGNSGNNVAFSMSDGRIDVVGDLTVYKNATFCGRSSFEAYVDGDCTVKGTLTFDGDSYVTGKLTVPTGGVVNIAKYGVLCSNAFGDVASVKVVCGGGLVLGVEDGTELIGQGKKAMIVPDNSDGVMSKTGDSYYFSVTGTAPKCDIKNDVGQNYTINVEENDEFRIASGVTISGTVHVTGGTISLSSSTTVTIAANGKVVLELDHNTSICGGGTIILGGLGAAITENLFENVNCIYSMTVALDDSNKVTFTDAYLEDGFLVEYGSLKISGELISGTASVTGEVYVDHLTIDEGATFDASADTAKIHLKDETSASIIVNEGGTLKAGADKVYGEASTNSVSLKSGGHLVYGTYVVDAVEDTDYSALSAGGLTYTQKFGANDGLTLTGLPDPLPIVTFGVDRLTALSSIGFTKATGYDFVRWCDKSDNTGAAMTAESFSDGYATIYAIARFYIDLDANIANHGASVSSTTVDVVGSTYANLANVTVTGATGYVFDSWNTLSTGAGTTVTSSSTVDSSITKLYAIYKLLSYEVAFNANGGVGTMPNESFTYATLQDLTANAFTRANYTFLGWNTVSDGSGTTYADKASVINLTETAGATVTLYAVWQGFSYSVAFNSNSGSGIMSSQSFYYGAAQNLTANVFTRSGFTFNGWNTASDGSGTAYADKASVSNLTETAGATVTLYAQWKAASSSGGSDNTMLYVGIGAVAVIVLAGAAFFIMKKKH